MRLVAVALAVAAVAACEPAIETVEVAPNQIAFKSAQDEKQLTATPKAKDGAAIEGKTAAFTSADPAVATVDSSGKVKPAGSGKTTITATIGEKSGTAEVSVQLLKGIRLDSPALVVPQGQPAPAMHVTFLNERGEVIEMKDATVTWKTADAAIATVDAAGVVTGVAAGSTVLTAAVDEQKAECQLTVTTPPTDAAAPGAPAPGAPAAPEKK